MKWLWERERDRERRKIFITSTNSGATSENFVYLHAASVENFYSMLAREEGGRVGKTIII